MISRSNLLTFAEQIGFLTIEKQHKLEDLLAGLQAWTIPGEFPGWICTLELLMAKKWSMI